jgi:hypothetical protein
VLDQVHEVLAGLVDARDRLAGLSVARVVGQHLLVQAARALRIVQILFEDLGGLAAKIASLGRRLGGVGATREHHAELLPLLGLTVDLGHALERDLVARVVLHDGLEARQPQVGSLELFHVPAAHAIGDQVLDLLRHVFLAQRALASVEDLAPAPLAGARQPLDLAHDLLL